MLCNRLIIAAALVMVAAGCSHFQHRNVGTASATETTINQGGRPVVVSPSAAVPAGVHHRVSGEVASVNRKTGEVTVRTAEGDKVTVALPPVAVATLKKGDRADFDMTFTPR